MATVSTIEERVVGTNDFITVDMTDNLATGETISGLPTLTPSNALVTLQAGTTAVSVDGKSFSARFLHNAAGYTRVDISCNTNLSSVVKKSYFTILTFSPPASA